MKRHILIPALLMLSACGVASTPRVPVEQQTGASATTRLSPRFDKKKNRVAILPFVNSGISGLDYGTPDKLALKLMEMGFIVVDRSQTEAIFTELKLNMSGAISPEQLKQVGKLLGIDLLAAGTLQYTRVPGSSYAYGNKFGTSGNSVEGYDRLDGETIRMIDIETGEVMISSFCCDEKFNGSSMAVEIAESIERQLFPEKHQSSF